MELTSDRYFVKFVGDDDALMDKFLAAVGSDDTKQYRDKKWNISSDTLKKILSSVPEKDLEIIENSCAEVGSLLKPGFALYNYQKDNSFPFLFVS